MILLALAWLRAHWCAAVIAATMALSFLGGWCARGPVPPAPPAVHEVIAVEQVKDTVAKVDTHETTGPETITITRDGDCKPRASSTSAPLEHVRTVTVIQRGPETLDTHATAQAEVKTETHATLDIVPQVIARPGWALQLGLEDVTGSRVVRLAARRRLLGELWVELAVTPARREVGAAISFQF